MVRNTKLLSACAIGSTVDVEVHLAGSLFLSLLLRLIVDDCGCSEFKFVCQFRRKVYQMFEDLQRHALKMWDLVAYP